MKSVETETTAAVVRSPNCHDSGHFLEHSGSHFRHASRAVAVEAENVVDAVVGPGIEADFGRRTESLPKQN